VVVRPFNFYSPRADPKSPYSGVITKFAQWAKNGEPLLVEGDGDQTRDFIHASDVAYMLRLLLESSVVNQTLNCGSGKATTVNQLAESVVKAAPRKSEIKHVQARIGDIRHSVSSIELASKIIGFEPRMSLDEGLQTFFQS
jgi:UDP-glucose 4-epimerase